MPSPVIALGVAALSALLVACNGGRDAADLTSTAALSTRADNTDELRWWKGNLHTHTFWSDGDSYPELAIDWYYQRDWNFLALTEHNVFAAGERWINAESKGGPELLAEYQARFPGWVETRDNDGVTEVRLKTHDEYSTLFDTPDDFLLIKAEELTASWASYSPVHLNATNIDSVIPVQSGNSVVEILQANIDAVLARREETGQPMMVHINHPNFGNGGGGVTVEDMIPLRGERFFEVYNGHGSVKNEGDAAAPRKQDTQRMWDIINAERLSQGLPSFYGLATDDAHNHRNPTFSPNQSNPGRGWVMVRAAELTPDALIAAMEAGDFYASTGVSLSELTVDEDSLSLRVDAEPGQNYTIQFVGTRKAYDRTRIPVAADNLQVNYQYSDEIGEVFAELKGVAATYQFRGDELYVRAVVRSDQPIEKPVTGNELQSAWTQPVVVP